MNVYQKLAEARLRLKKLGLKQSGKNKGVGYTYFDLQDILPNTTAIEHELGLLSTVSFTESEGTLSIINTEKPEETIVFKSPTRDAELRGCHPVQNLGAVETYVRRYLYLLAYEIVETDALDLTQESKKGGDGRADDKPRSAPQNSNNAIKSEAKSKARRISDLINGTDIEPSQVTEYIETNFGEKLRVNDLTDAQFDKLYTALTQYIKGVIE